MARPEQLRNLYAKIEEARTQVMMLMNAESDRGPATDTKLRGFIIDNRPFPNSTEVWADGLRAICDILSIIYRDDFDKVLCIRRWFSKKPCEDFPKDNNPYSIRDTGIFVDVWSDSNKKKEIVERLGEIFGCQIDLDYYKPE